LRTDQQR
jgi:hypothetical protein